MTKVKQGIKTMDHSPTDLLKAVKNNPIQKKKTNKFANTPTGKVRLMNGKKEQNSEQKQLNKKQKEKKQVIKDSPDSPDSNSSSPKTNEKNNSPKQISNATKTLNSPDAQSGKNNKKSKKNLKNKTDKSNESLEDINEGIVLAEDSIVSQGDVDDNDIESEEESDTNIPNILGQSLADDTDEDDSDFEAEEDEESENDDSDKDETSQLKGVKMFKGLLKQKLDSTKKDESKDDDDDDDDNNDDDDDDNDDEDDNEMDESMVVTDDSISSGTKKNKKNINLTENEEEDEDSEDDEDDEDEDEDEDEEESSPGLKDLLGNSIMDDDDNDEDFEGEDEDDEDIDISDEESETEVDKEDKEKRTIFVSNIPVDTNRKEIKKVFKEFGPIESIRIRGVAPSDAKISKKVAIITKQLHKDVDSIHMLVVFKNKQSVSKALSMNGKKFKNHILRVDAIGKDQAKPNTKNAVFLGNLPFSIKDNDVWKHFEECGEIDFIRLIKDKRTRMGKGVGYVNFKKEDSVTLALELNGSTLGDREIRVKRCSEESSVSKEPKNNRNKRSRSAESNAKTSPKKPKVNNNNKTQSPVQAGKKKLKPKHKLQENGSPNTETKKTTFQGQKATVGKKGKKSTLDKKKKKMAAILTSKPKKIQKV